MGNAIAEKSMSRRGFVAAAGAVAGLAAANVALADEAAEVFDESFDVIVVGYGFAGATSAIYAADAGAKVLLIDGAPKGHEGGNSRYCAQIVAAGDDEEALLEYYKQLAYKMEYDEDVLKAFVHGQTTVNEIYARYGIDEPVSWTYIKEFDKPTAEAMGIYAPAFGYPEFPELVGSENIDFVTAHDGFADAFFYLTAQDTVDATEGITVWYESPARHLIQDPATRRITGVVIEHEGAELRVEATSGVVLACGGFEDNQKMIQDYLGVPHLSPIGGLYNNGDGIRMAQEVGADLWHMHNFESTGFFGCHTWASPSPDGRYTKYSLRSGATGGMICVGDDGTRYVREDTGNRHGHVYMHGVWRVPCLADTPYMVFDGQQKAILEEAGDMPDNVDELLLSAETAEELAGLIGVDPATLAQTVADYNYYCEVGRDYECGRDPQTMRALEGTLYALPLSPMMLNTQGGPRRNAKGQIMGVDGQPIPGLFGAGECGGICIYYYQGASNVAECLIFGRISGTNAAKGVA